MKVALLSSSDAGLPALQWLAGQRVITSLGAIESPENEDIIHAAGAFGVPVHLLKDAAPTVALEKWMEEVPADIVLVIGYPHRIPEALLERPALGFYNVHFGALPVYGGRTPLFWQLLNQEKAGELTIHRMNANFDSGPVAVRLPVPVQPGDTYGLLLSRYAMAAIEGIFRLLSGLQQNTLELIPQEKKASSFLPGPGANEVVVSWHRMTAAQAEALIRACNPWNRGAITRLKGWMLKLVEATVMEEHTQLPPGTLAFGPGNSALVACAGQTVLRIDILYAREGYFSGPALARFGIRSGDSFDAL